MNGARLKELRKEKGLTRREVSIAVGITEGTLYTYETAERSNPTIETVNKLASFYGVPATELI